MGDRRRERCCKLRLEGIHRGRRDRRHVSSISRPKVIAKVRELAKKRGAGLGHAADESMKLEERLRYWISSIAPAQIRPRTLASHHNSLRRHIISFLGKRRLDQLTAEESRPLRFDVDSCRKVLAPAEGRRNEARWTVALAFRLRQSEALGSRRRP